MAENTLPETDDWVDGIYQLETDDKVLGGPDGVSNRQGRELASRTRFLKSALAVLGTALSAHATSRDHPSATTKLRGMTRLATLDEHADGRDDVAATPAGVVARIAEAFSSVKTPQATTETAGISREATTAEATSGVSTTPNALPHVTPEGLAAARWNARAIGEPFQIWDHLAGAEIPPTAAGGPRFIKLTAGDAYNDGLLSGESVSGSAPDITATAVIALADSPLYGQTVHLINTERRFLRGGESGVIEGDAIRNITGSIWGGFKETFSAHGDGVFKTSSVQSLGNQSVTSGWGAQFILDASLVVPTASENRSRNISAPYYLRIF